MTPYPHIEMRDGKPFIIGTKVAVETLWRWREAGQQVETIWSRYPHLPRHKLLAALAFAYDNPHLFKKETA